MENSTTQNQPSGEMKAQDCIKLDLCGLQCPGPIMKVFKKMNEMPTEAVLSVCATDPGFSADLDSMVSAHGNKKYCPAIVLLWQKDQIASFFKSFKYILTKKIGLLIQMSGPISNYYLIVEINYRNLPLPFYSLF